ncbi:hypothetical protein F5148DRAFT_1374191 [Russula earlei]|uniref:Uncharacterized protein n=1 Tax=Russula earlei TaxID=71964 RepID=A0ACC0UGU4_9AGAM|nr:hypothetical protein F5148DRAFT_1374191 [Russula earlei]
MAFAGSDLLKILSVPRALSLFGRTSAGVTPTSYVPLYLRSPVSSLIFHAALALRQLINILLTFLAYMYAFIPPVLASTLLTCVSLLSILVPALSMPYTLSSNIEAEGAPHHSYSLALP